jgi:hypothetical protein
MEWGETLEIEAAKSGSSFLQQSELQSEAWRCVVEDEVGNNNQKLYGGAQVSAECCWLNACERGWWPLIQRPASWMSASILFCHCCRAAQSCVFFLTGVLGRVLYMLTLYFPVCLFNSQYHRSMREFTVAVRHMAAQVVTEDEIANAAGKLSC